MAPLYIPDYTHYSTYHLSIYSITPIPVPPFYPLDYTNLSATFLSTRLHPSQCHPFTYSITPIPMPPFYLLDYTHPFYLHDYTLPFYLLDYTHSNVTFLSTRLHPFLCHFFYLLDYTHSNATFLPTRFIVCNLVLVMNIQSIININNHYPMPKTMRKDSITIYRSMSSPN